MASLSPCPPWRYLFGSGEQMLRRSVAAGRVEFLAIVAHFHPDLVFTRRATSSILPSSGVNLIALATRFIRICLNRIESA